MDSIELSSFKFLLMITTLGGCLDLGAEGMAVFPEVLIMLILVVCETQAGEQEAGKGHGRTPAQFFFSAAFF